MAQVQGARNAGGHRRRDHRVLCRSRSLLLGRLDACGHLQYTGRTTGWFTQAADVDDRSGGALRTRRSLQDGQVVRGAATPLDHEEGRIVAGAPAPLLLQSMGEPACIGPYSGFCGF